jgi:hypothetical protein
VLRTRSKVALRRVGFESKGAGSVRGRNSRLSSRDCAGCIGPTCANDVPATNPACLLRRPAHPHGSNSLFMRRRILTLIGLYTAKERLDLGWLPKG